MHVLEFYIISVYYFAHWPIKWVFQVLISGHHLNHLISSFTEVFHSTPRKLSLYRYAAQTRLFKPLVPLLGTLRSGSVRPCDQPHLCAFSDPATHWRTPSASKILTVYRLIATAMIDYQGLSSCLDLVLEVHCSVLRKSSTIPDSQVKSWWRSVKASTLRACVYIRCTN